MAFTSWRRSPEKRKHLKGLLRASAYVAVVGVVCSVVQVRAARAELGDRTIALGRQMLQLANANTHDVTKITLNGQEMWIGASVAKDSPKAVLDRYEGHCKTDAAQPADSWRQLVEKDPSKADGGFLSNGLLRAGDEKEGTVVCFTRSQQSKTSVKEALTAFGQTGELGALGDLRYVYSYKNERTGKTVVLTAWTHDKFNLVDMMPEEGKDAPGSDFDEIPRLPGSDRVFSGRAEGTPFGVNVYRTMEAPSKVMDFYDAQMSERGWFTLDAETDQSFPEEFKNDKFHGRLYEKEGVVLTLGAHVQEGATFASLGLAGVVSSEGKSAQNR